MGTTDGLCRYDGYGLHVFRSSPMYPTLLPHNDIREITETRDGKILIGTQKGMCAWDKRANRFISFTDSLLTNYEIRSIVTDDEGYIWVGSYKNLVRISPDLSEVKSYDSLFTGADGSEQRATVFDFEGAGVLQGQYNKDDSIRSFARSCFNYALDVKQDLWFGAKDTISKKYDHTFKDIFQEVYDAEYKAKFEAAGITYFYSLIDDIVARVIRSEGGFVWACKNYDGDVMSDMVSTAFGSLAMMTSVLVSPDGKYEFEAAHGTVTRHYYKYLKGEKTSTNPMATIFAWSGAFKKRGELDGLPELVKFGEALEAASLQTLNDGIMTKDLCGLAEGITPTAVDSEGFIKAIRTRLEAKMA